MNLLIQFLIGLKVSDRDEDDVDTCRIADDYLYSDPTLGSIITPFTVRNPTFDVILNFEVQDAMKGFFTLNVTCFDLGN